MNAQRPEGSVGPSSTGRTKVFGIGLNKTGTKTMARYLRSWGYRHRTYDSDNVYESPSFELYARGDVDGLLDIAENFDSMEDWPWPMLYRELDARFPDAKFVLTTRESPEVWYRSLCKMAVRIGPLPLYETKVYGSSMPHGRRAEHLRIYCDHIEAVKAHFAPRPDKLLCLTLGDSSSVARLAEFLEIDQAIPEERHVNRSPDRIYAGDSLFAAHFHRLLFQTFRAPGSFGVRAMAAWRVRVLRRSR